MLACPVPACSTHILKILRKLRFLASCPLLQSGTWNGGRRPSMVEGSPGRRELYVGVKRNTQRCRMLGEKSRCTKCEPSGVPQTNPSTLVGGFSRNGSQAMPRWTGCTHSFQCLCGWLMLTVKESSQGHYCKQKLPEYAAYVSFPSAPIHPRASDESTAITCCKQRCLDIFQLVNFGVYLRRIASVLHIQARWC